MPDDYYLECDLCGGKLRPAGVFRTFEADNGSTVMAISSIRCMCDGSQRGREMWIRVVPPEITAEPEPAEPVCAECGTPVKEDDRREIDDEPYHWSCAQEFFERERLADGEDA